MQPGTPQQPIVTVPDEDDDSNQQQLVPSGGMGGMDLPVARSNVGADIASALQVTAWQFAMRSNPAVAIGLGAALFVGGQNGTVLVQAARNTRGILDELYGAVGDLGTNTGQGLMTVGSGLDLALRAGANTTVDYVRNIKNTLGVEATVTMKGDYQTVAIPDEYEGRRIYKGKTNIVKLQYSSLSLGGLKGSVLDLLVEYNYDIRYWLEERQEWVGNYIGGLNVRTAGESLAWWSEFTISIARADAETDPDSGIAVVTLTINVTEKVRGSASKYFIVTLYGNSDKYDVRQGG